MSTVDLLNGQVLAYIGDSVMTLMVRQYLVAQGFSHAKELTEKAASFLCANVQAQVVEQLLQEDFLTPEEQQIYRLGRNHKSNSKAKNAKVLAYRAASGFEAIWGYWQLKNNPQRLSELWNKTRTMVEEKSW